MKTGKHCIVNIFETRVSEMTLFLRCKSSSQHLIPGVGSVLALCPAWISCVLALVSGPFWPPNEGTGARGANCSWASQMSSRSLGTARRGVGPQCTDMALLEPCLRSLYISEHRSMGAGLGAL